MQRLPQTLSSLFAVALLSACAGSKTAHQDSAEAAAAVSQPTAKPAPVVAVAAAKDGWWLKVCREKMKTDHIDFGIGPDKDQTYSYKWTNNDPSEFDVRQDYRNVQDLYVKGDGDHGKAKYFCKMYKERLVRHYDFDNDEDAKNSQNDHDNECAC